MKLQWQVRHRQNLKVLTVIEPARGQKSTIANQSWIRLISHLNRFGGDQYLGCAERRTCYRELYSPFATSNNPDPGNATI